jgi:hypothetical protein
MAGSLPQNGNFKGFKPNYNHFYGYMGSLTTPPCTEGVQVGFRACVSLCLCSCERAACACLCVHISCTCARHHLIYTSSLEQWLVLGNPIYAEESEITPFKDLQGDNFRAVQVFSPSLPPSLSLAPLDPPAPPVSPPLAVIRSYSAALPRS